MSPAFWYCSSARVRLVARATGVRAAYGGRLPGARRHAGRAALGDDDAVAAEGGDGADDGTEVARVGHAVEGDDQRVRALVVGGGDQVLGVRVLVGRDLEDETLVVEPLVIRSSSGRGASMRLMPPRSAAIWSASRTRSSLSMNCWT